MFGKRKHLGMVPPPDDRAPGDGYINAGWQNGSADDDARHHKPFLSRRYGAGTGTDESAYRTGLQALQGAHFRIGYQGYFGVQDFAPMQSAMGDTVIGRPIVMRPPTIPRRSATPNAVRNALYFVQSMPGETWVPIVAPMVSRR